MQYNLDNEALARLETYIHTLSPSMAETAMTKCLESELRDFGADISVDHMGNMVARIEGESDFTLALSAHVDTVAVQVTNILPSGVLQFRSIGLLPHTLLGQPVQILAEGGVVHGSVGFDATSQYGQPKGLVFEDLWIDIGASSVAEASDMVSVGDLGVLEPRFQLMNGGKRISATSIDNKIGIFCIMEALRHLGSAPLPVNIEVIATVQEEVGLRGSMIARMASKADACIVIDVDYATDIPASHENQLSKVILGRGNGVHFKADNNAALRALLIAVAEKHRRDIQKCTGRYLYGGTDATQMQVLHGGVPTANMTIPCRYIHSPVETCDVCDVQNAIALLADLTRSLGEMPRSTFIPRPSTCA